MIKTIGGSHVSRYHRRLAGESASTLAGVIGRLIPEDGMVRLPSEHFRVTPRLLTKGGEGQYYCRMAGLMRIEEPFGASGSSHDIFLETNT